MTVVANDNFVLCKPLKDKESASDLNSFLSGDNELLKLEVVITSNHPHPDRNSGTKLYQGDFVFVRGNFAESHYNQNVYKFGDITFIRVPHNEIILIESVYKTS
jgi:hypothetical protein